MGVVRAVPEECWAKEEEEEKMEEGWIEIIKGSVDRRMDHFEGTERSC